MRSWARGHATSVIALFALAITAALVGRILWVLDWDVTSFVGFGAEATETRAYAEELLGDVFLRGDLGHDGKFFFVQANDPWVADPSTNAELLDFPVYRSRRMLYPLLAGGLGLLGPETIVWNLVVVNVVGMTLGTLGTARLSRSMGGSPWWGLAFLGNLGLIFTLTIDGAGVLAAAFAIWAVAFLYEGHMLGGIGMLAAAVLTREVMLICAIGVAAWLWSQARRRDAMLAIAIPSLALGVWEVYLRSRLGPGGGTTGTIGFPLVGLVRAVPRWIDDPLTLAAGLCMVAIAIIFTVRWWVGRSLIGWTFVGFVPLAVVMTAKVWTQIFDFSRALAPLLTATILLLFVEGRRERGADSNELAILVVGE
jgi:hypothetical protein